MHEEALFHDLREKLFELARLERAERILEVKIWVGALSHVTEERLRTEWPRLTGGTPALGSRLDVDVSTDPSEANAGSVLLVSVVLPGPEAP